MSTRFGRFVLIPALLGGLAWGDAPARVLFQATDDPSGVNVPGRLDAAGSRYVYTSTGDPLGTNPTRAFQMFARDVASGTVEQWTDDPRGGALAAAVSDDGTRVAFLSAADPVGTNPDRSAEVFAREPDGTVRQLTSATVGSAGLVALSGDGGTVVFTSTADPTGGNPEYRAQVFAVAWDGTGLRQLTALAGDAGTPTVSDDGTRVAFVSDADPLGTNPDRSTELFAILADGTGLRQLTAAPAGSTCAFPWIAGNGTRIAVQCDADLTGGNADLGDEVFLVEWADGTIDQLTASTSLIGEPFAGAPSMTDDGETVFYHSNQNSFLTNIDGNVEIWRIARNGTGRTALTSTALDIGSLLPLVSGNGGRVAYVSISDPTGGNPDGNLELYWMTGTGASDEQLTDTVWGWTTAVAVAGDGSRIVFASTANVGGLDPERNGELYAVARDGSDLVALTSTTAGTATAPSVSSDGGRIAFASDADPAGTNADGSTEIFVVEPGGGAPTQLTSAGALDGDSGSPAISGDATRIAFTSDTDPLGTNPEGNVELFAIGADGTGLIQLTATAGGSAGAPSIDASGTWIAFSHSGDPVPGANPEGNRELFVVRTDGTGLAQRTATAAGASDAPDLDPDGLRIVFRSSADLDGGNPDGNREIHRIGVDGSDPVRLTDTVEGDCGGPAWSDGGTTVTFPSSAPFAGPNPDGVVDVWRIADDGTGLERLTANRLGGLPGGADALFGAGSSVAVAHDAGVVALGLLGDPVAANPDLVPETFVVDLDRPWTVRVEGAASTVLAWDARAGARSYDVVRGDLDALAGGGGDPVGLGAVLCLVEDTPDLDTAGAADEATPAPGSGFFYLVRPDDGLEPPTWGTGTGGGERTPDTGDCVP